MGLAGSLHLKEETVVVLVFAKGVLKSGQNENINVTVTDKVSSELIQNMKMMGIDSNRIKVIQDTDKTVTVERASKLSRQATA